MKAVLSGIFHDQGLRFVFSTRSATPHILKEDGKPFFDEGYTFIPGKDEIIREGSAGWIVSYGEMLYRCLDVVEHLKGEGLSVGLVNKPTLNVADEPMLERIGKSPFVLTVESQSVKTGLGARFGTWLLERGLHPRYGAMGAVREGCGGLCEQIPYQGLGGEDILRKIKSLL